MTDEHYESLRRHILDLKVEIEELKLMLKKQNEIADHRFSLLYDWCAPAELKEEIERSALPEHLDIPEDIRKLLGG